VTVSASTSIWCQSNPRNGGVRSTATTGVFGSKAVQETPKVPDRTVEWKQSNPNSEKTYQQATIIADNMTVDWDTRDPWGRS
jgi:hypothetical protein